MRIAALGVLRVVQLTRAEAGIAQNPLQGPWETKGAQASSVKERPDAARMLGLLGWHCSCGEDGAGASNGQEGRRSGPAALALGSRVPTTPPQWKGSVER
jgi:hypothetical protein